MDLKPFIASEVDKETSVHQVYIEAYKEDDDCFSVNIEGLVVTFVFHICKNHRLVLNIRFLEEKPKDYNFTLSNNEVEFRSLEKDEKFLNALTWPIMCVDNIVIGGICSVARQLLKSSYNEQLKTLLGFREGCLIACSENSVWTKFCEVDIIETIENLLLNPENYIKGDALELPVNVCRFEYHMMQPIRVHNIYKLAQEKLNNKKLDSKTPIDKLEMNHEFSDGPFMTLADVILYLPFHIFFKFFHSSSVEEKLPQTFAWYTRMRDKIPKIDFNYPQFDKFVIEKIIEPSFEKQSLYKADPKRYKPEKRVFTKQPLIEKALDAIKCSDISFHNECRPFGYFKTIDWNNIPDLASPLGGALPKKRLERKCQQLESMANAVINIVNDQQNRVIVDFCSGGGHLGIFLAYLLPNCTVILVENKEQSLLRANKRIEALQLKNVQLYQGNLDYFKCSFDIGVSLHACGSATDLVIQKSIQKKAHFICCPCCYGGIKACHDLSYPKSGQFKKLNLNYNDYLSIAHAADQTHEQDNAKTEQGYFCMDVIDTDRKLHAENVGYEVYLGKLEPFSCTNKNNLLVGIYSAAR